MPEKVKPQLKQQCSDHLFSWQYQYNAIFLSAECKLFYIPSLPPALGTSNANYENKSRNYLIVKIRACERSGAGSERGVERAKYSRSTEWVFIQRPERSLCLAPVPLQYRSHHEPRACTNPPRIHLCLQQLTKLSAYTSKIVRCEGEMEFVKYFQKQTDRSYRCTIPVKKNRW